MTRRRRPFPKPSTALETTPMSAAAAWTQLRAGIEELLGGDPTLRKIGEDLIARIPTLTEHVLPMMDSATLDLLSKLALDARSVCGQAHRRATLADEQGSEVRTGLDATSWAVECAARPARKTTIANLQIVVCLLLKHLRTVPGAEPHRR